MAFIVAAPAIAAPDGPKSNEKHLRRALQYWQAGDYAHARQEFETVFRLDDLPPDFHAQTDVYADTAKALLDGASLVTSGYVVANIGKYHENDSIAGAGQVRDFFGGVRVGGRIIGVVDALTINAGLDYRFRKYDDEGRRNDSDLRWNLGASRALGSANWSFGARGWASYRGENMTRNDVAVHTSLRFREGADDQFEIGGELRRRIYPKGRLRYRSRDIVQANASWTHAIADGRASIGLAGHGGREFPTQERPDGNSNFFGLLPSLDVTISERFGVHAFGWWQNDRYAVERFGSYDGDGVTGVGKRNDNLYEVGGGLTWNFAPGWELAPAFLYIRDRSNIVGVNDSSTEFTLALRRDF